MANEKLGRPTKERLALIRSQATALLWNGKIETTVEKAKVVKSYTEKILTLAINTYKDTATVKKEIVKKDGNKTLTNVVVDGKDKLAARRAIMNKVYDVQEQRVKDEKKEDFDARTKGIKHPLIEKIFNVYAPKYEKRAEELGQRGGYTRIIRTGKRQGDNAEMAVIELI